MKYFTYLTSTENARLKDYLPSLIEKRKSGPLNAESFILILGPIPKIAVSKDINILIESWENYNNYQDKIKKLTKYIDTIVSNDGY